jgi:pre-mRNA-splicing factor 38A
MHKTIAIEIIVRSEGGDDGRIAIISLSTPSFQRREDFISLFSRRGFMANVTDPLARSVHGTNPQNLIEYITRQRVMTHSIGRNIVSAYRRLMSPPRQQKI